MIPNCSKAKQGSFWIANWSIYQILSSNACVGLRRGTCREIFDQEATQAILPNQEKQQNCALARLRVRVEVTRRCKIFIFLERYRNRRRRFGLRLNLIAGSLNYELADAS